MRRRHRLRAPGLAAAAALALVASACGSTARSSPSAGASARAPFVIGALFSRTGAADVFGPQQVAGASLAVDRINARGGVDGVRLKLLVEDDQSDPATGALLMRDLIKRSRVVGVLGPTLSAVALEADPVANTLHTPVLAISNTIDHIVGDCSYPCTWIWRDSLGERVAVRANVDAYVRAHHPSVAAVILSADDVLGSDGAQHARAAFRNDGVHVLPTILVQPNDSIPAAVRRAIAARPQALFVGTASATFAVAVMKAAHAQGYRGAILGGNTFNSAITRSLAGAAGAGALSGAAWWSGNAFPANAEFTTAYRQAFGRAPDQFAAQAYTGVEIIADALRRAGAARETTLVARRDALQRGLGDVAVTSVLGPFRFNRSHDVNQIAWILAMDKSGGNHLVDFCDPGC